MIGSTWGEAQTRECHSGALRGALSHQRIFADSFLTPCGKSRAFKRLVCMVGDFPLAERLHAEIRHVANWA